MKINSFMDLYLKRGSIFRKLIDIGEWVVILSVAIFFPRPRINFYPLNYLLGIGFFILGFYLHYLAHKTNPYAHCSKDKVEKLITNGIYRKMRHPVYAGYILMYLGAFFTLSSLWTLFPISIFSLIFYHSAMEEERFLSKKFGQEYQLYIMKVPWKFIPYIF
ncbi:MAG: isoprenylcysteine carboxylmethyltransferase family protein [Candidatus Omnitrophica bacterium]|nr:isoprenylcysteine carboxylmethyltransferase family protein [Candidatus Omnitrophota bacterium]